MLVKMLQIFEQQLPQTKPVFKDKEMTLLT